jgi:hypothetical protein
VRILVYSVALGRQVLLGSLPTAGVPEPQERTGVVIGETGICRPSAPCGRDDCPFCGDEPVEIGNGDEPEPPPHPAETADVEDGGELELIDWSTVSDNTESIVDGFIIAGRWTAISSGAKAGKSTLAVSVGIELSEGRHPFDGTPQDPIDVVHLDAELGRIDLGRLVSDCGHDPVKLERWHATDLPPRLDFSGGAERALRTINRLVARLVVVDGLNGVVSGAEKDDLPWRALFEQFIRPLKAAGVAIITNDNEGHDQKRSRGSSVKIDKPDCVIHLTQTETGVKLAATHRRTTEFWNEIVLAGTGFDGSVPVRYRRSGGGWLAGTKRVAELLDSLGVPPDAGREIARRALLAAAADAESRDDDDSRFRVRTDVLASAVRWRKSGGDRFGDRSIPDDGDR